MEKGLVGGIALSEVSAETIRRAARVVQIVAVENELSLWTRDALSNGVAEVCGELGIPLVAYVLSTLLYRPRERGGNVHRFTALLTPSLL